jgi:hypothetical protein
MLEKKLPSIPDDPQSAGTIFIEKQLLKIYIFIPILAVNNRAFYELGDARGFSQKILYFYKDVLVVWGHLGYARGHSGYAQGYSGIPQYPTNSDTLECPRISGILGNPRG